MVSLRTLPPSRSPGSLPAPSRPRVWDRRRRRRGRSPSCRGRRSSPSRGPRPDGYRRAQSRLRGCRATSFLALAHLVDGVLRNLDGNRSVLHARLARKARGEREAPRLVEEVVFLLRGRVERLVAFAHDDMAGRARAALLAGVLDLDVVLEERVSDGGPPRRP